MKFRLLVGMHIGNDPSGKNGPNGRPLEKVYHVGDIIDSDVDLCLLNGAGMTPKFERVHDDSFSDPSIVRQGDGESLQEFAKRVVNLAETERRDKEAASKPLPNQPTQAQPPQPSQSPQPSQQATTPPTQAPTQPNPPAHPTPIARREGQGGTDATGNKLPNLDAMSIQELRRYAQDEEIDLGTAVKREDIIKTIKSVVRT